MTGDYLDFIGENSPFAFGKVAIGEMFINRQNDKKHLASNFINGINSIIISPRRWGKSSLVKEVSHDVSKKYKHIRFAYVDLFSVRTESEFMEAYAKAIIKCSSSKFEEWLLNAKNYLRAISPKISVDPTFNQEFSLSFDVKQIKNNADTILNLAETISQSRKIKIIVCIDEFQNIDNFTRPVEFQKKLRSYWQQHQHATYCLYGSRKSMLMQMFEKKAMPFFKFGEVIYLPKIERKYWIPFISEGFKKTGKTIAQSHIERIVDYTQEHPYYTQQLCYLVWSRSKRSVKEQDVSACIMQMVNQNANLFEREIESMSRSKINILKAIADGFHSSFSSAEVISTYDLGSSANVVKTMKALDMEEIIDKRSGAWYFIDPVFELWFKHRMMNKQIL
jgi:AAA+ ATPase superfamily predicted ATPase